jgi:hypothetical protein
MTLSNANVVVELHHDNIDGESNDDLFIEIAEITAIQAANFDDLLHRIVDRKSIEIHESVDSWLYDDEPIEDEDDFWLFNGSSKEPYIFE